MDKDCNTSEGVKRLENSTSSLKDGRLVKVLEGGLFDVIGNRRVKSNTGILLV